MVPKFNDSLLSIKAGMQSPTLYAAMILLLVGAVRSSGIQLRHTYSPSRAVIGGKLTYTYRLENDGEADESGTLFTNKLPPNTVFVSAVVTNGAFTVSNNVFSLRPERLLAGETNVIQVVVTPVIAFAATNHAWWVSSAGVAVHSFSVVPVDSARSGPQLAVGRSYHTSTLLRDGRVLVTGGWTRAGPYLLITNAAELYSPAEDSFSLVGGMMARRADHTATLLTNGMVLVAGGTPEQKDPAGGGLLPETAEIFDPVSNKFSVVATLLVRRAQHTATLLPNGDVILAGGAGTNTIIERLHSENGRWTTLVAGLLQEPRTQHMAWLLPNGKIMFAGGTTRSNAFAEVFDPESRKSERVQSSGSQLPVAAASRGKILLEGYLPGYVPAAEIYDIEANTFTALSLPPNTLLDARSNYLLLDNGNLLFTGSAAHIFDLRAGTVTVAPALAARHWLHTTVQFSDGRILLIGGYINNDMSSDMRTTEFYAFRLDSDLDGMEDDWELANGFNPTRREDAIDDADGDGHTNLQEFLAGTDPHDPSNVLKIEPPQITDNQMHIRFPTALGKYYQVERSVASDPRTWVIVAGNIPGSGRTIDIQDPIDAGGDPRFYRVLLLP